MNPVTAHIPLTTPRDYTRALIREVADRHLVPVKDIVVGRSRQKRIVAARHAAIVHVAQARPHLSLPELGRLFRLDHTTIMHALGKRKREPQTYPAPSNQSVNHLQPQGEGA